MEYKVPLIIKEALGEDVYNQVSDVMKNNEEEKKREWVIYGTPKFWDAVYEEIEKELLIKYNKL